MGTTPYLLTIFITGKNDVFPLQNKVCAYDTADFEPTLVP